MRNGLKPVVRLWLRLTALGGLAWLGYALLAASIFGGKLTGTLPGFAVAPLAGIVPGLTGHFGLMGAMSGAGLVLARHTFLGEVTPWKAGTLYGLALYMVMHGLVLPWRSGVPFPDPDRLRLAIQLVPYVLFVGLPVFVLARQVFGLPPQANSADLRSS